MPSGSRRRTQCTFREGKYRCRRDGVGNPVLCAPHKIVVAEQARQAERDAQPGGAVRSLIDDFFHGRSFSTEKVAQAVNEFAYNLGGIFGMGGGPELFNEEIDEDSGHQQYVPSPPPRDELAEKRAALRRAKVELGFAADEPVTLQQVKDRHRLLARRHHPDRGGSVEKMQTINAAVDLLEQAL